jgi:flagellar hook-associated protein 2
MGSTGSTTSSNSTPIYFTGVSTYSSDFQQIIQRAVQIAQLPVTALQTQVTDNTDKNTTLEALDPAVAAVGSDVAALGALASSQGLTASSSDPSLVSVVNTGATAPATYTISNISSLAAAASETSLTGYSDTQAVSTTGTMNLMVGSTNYTLDLTGTGQNNINGLAAAINNAGAGVNATVLTSGSQNYLVVSANNSGATTLQVSDVQASADLVSNTGSGTETSSQTFADATTAAVSATGQLSLVVGSTNYNLNITGSNNLNGLVQAINNANAGVTASVTGSSGSYSLSITAFGGPNTIQLNGAPPAELLSDTNQGTNATFELNGISITQSSNNVAGVIPGVSFTLQGQTTGSVTLSLASNGSQLSSALQSLTTDYNTLLNQVQAQQGPTAGPLGGDLLINQISEDMQQLVTYWNPSSTSSVRSLSDLGVTLSETGQMSFDPTAISAFSDSQLSDAFKFLGSSSSGLGALASNFTQLTDPISGMIENEESGLTQENNSLNSQIATLNAQVAQVQAGATAQAQQADALVAELQNEQSSLDASIESLNYVLYGKPTSSL